MSIILRPEYIKATSRVEDTKELVFERKEKADIKKKIQDYFSKGSNTNITLFSGNSGSGKTTTILSALIDVIEENPQFKNNFIYIDGNQIKTPSNVINTIIKRIRGRPLTRDENPFVILPEEIHQQNRRFLIIIDEIDKIYNKSRDSPKTAFLLSLHRMDTKPRHAIFLITNKFNFKKTLYDATNNSELTADVFNYTLPQYALDDIYHILDKRAKYCLQQGSYTMADLMRVANEVFRNPLIESTANSRHAINILEKAVMLAEENGDYKIGSYIDDASSFVWRDDYIRLLNKYNIFERTLIKAIVQLHNERRKGAGIYSKLSHIEIMYSDIKERFFSLIEGSKMPTERSLHNYLDSLLHSNIIKREQKNVYRFLEDADQIMAAMASLSAMEQ